ncbi:GPP34 family phosphoprotein [Arthrobacter sp. U41]|uniref:GOLPH3/VPS74 family protein n=1 Tax=Arthrobacter sp. U41 TaxID=1849032 RepID=UPI0011A86D1E|nr:GPP34 family phosphoprotein [Arthrobacter sp. U41]
MDAETPQPVELSLPQAFLLLATNDKDGKPEVPVFALRTTVAGAILAELELTGAIGLQGKHIKATGAALQTDFQHELELIRGKSRPHTPKQWVSMLEGRAEVQRVYEGMAAQGIVEHVGARHLGLFRTVRYPEKDHAPEAALMEKIQAALNGATPEPAKPDAEAPAVATPDAAPDAEAPAAATPDAEPVAEAPDVEPAKPDTKPVSTAPDPRITALIAMLQAAGLFGKLFPTADRGRASELAKDYWPSRAVEDELLMVRLAQEEEATL